MPSPRTHRPPRPSCPTPAGRRLNLRRGSGLHIAGRWRLLSLMWQAGSHRCKRTRDRINRCCRGEPPSSSQKAVERRRAIRDCEWHLRQGVTAFSKNSCSITLSAGLTTQGPGRQTSQRRCQRQWPPRLRTIGGDNTAHRRIALHWPGVYPEEWFCDRSTRRRSPPTAAYGDPTVLEAGVCVDDACRFCGDGMENGHKDATT
jgi:hypothetical protein